MKRCSSYWVLSLFVFVAMVLLFNSSSCYALSYDEIQDYVNQTADYYSSNSNYQTIKNLVNNNANVITFLNNNASNYSAICLGRNASFNHNYNITLANFTKISTNGIAWSGNGNSITISYDTRYSSTSAGTNTNFTNSSPSAFGNTIYMRSGVDQYSQLTAMCYENFESYTGSIGATYVGKDHYSTITNLEFVNDVENSAYNGNIFTYYIQGDFYSNDKIKIGNIIPNDSYYFELRLKDSVSGIVKGTSFVSLNTSPYNYYNDGGIFIDSNNDVYVIPRLLKLSQQYQLEITSYYGDGGSDLFEDIEWFIFLPQNAVIENGVITSLGSGDYTIQNSVNDTIDFYTDYSQVNNEIDNFFSGDTNEIVSNLNFPNLENNYYVVIYNVVAGISDTLRMSGDPYFDFSLHGETPKRIYASDFTTPPSVLKTFISMSLVFGTLYILYMQLSGFIMLLNTGQIKDAINQIDDISGATLYKM